MDDLFQTGSNASHGYRLHKFEMYNWGTFDSARGNIHTVRPEGATTLLIGQNGSGKSTLVDALLTLLVRPVVRNYNVAAGAHKQERDERTYIKGAYGRFSRDEDNKSEPQFLRPDGRQYASLLACFRNERDEAFTLAEILYLNAEGRSEKVYCFSQGERSIANDCANLASTDRVRQQMEKRGFRATTSYTEYHGWFSRCTGIRPKAMDMLNQTVAVKDIQSLNRFIREHMLESKPWIEKIDSLQNHFTQLSEAHQSLVRVRRQFELLVPVVEKGSVYREKAKELEGVQRLLSAADSYFRSKTVELIEPECELRRQQLAQQGVKLKQFDDAMSKAQEESRRITNEIDKAGGDRLRQIPLLIQNHRTQATTKRDAHRRLQDALTILSLPTQLADAAALANVHGRLPGMVQELDRDENAAKKERDAKTLERGLASRQVDEDRRELEALQRRQGNLPEAIAEVRRQLCEDLRLSEKELPFVAELVAVKPEEREWEASIEMVLRGFALSLLVPQRYYALTSAYIDRTRVVDGRGRGQRLVYLRVGERAAPSVKAGGMNHPQSLLRKLNLREGHPVLPWVRGELEERFNFVCCQTIQEFQSANDLALTRERHVKMRGTRHEKDDRERVSDPRNFVLGWENKEKRRHLAGEIQLLQAEMTRLDGDVKRLDDQLQRLHDQKSAILQIKPVTDFNALDFGAHEREIDGLNRERKSLEENNDVIRVLKERLGGMEDECKRLQGLRDDVIREEDRLKIAIAEGEQLVKKAQEILNNRDQAGVLTKHRECFVDFDASFKDTPLTVATLFQEEQRFLNSRNEDVDRLRREIDPLKDALCTSMNHYLRDFPDEQADLQATVEYFDSFCSLCEQIRRDDLPRHEARFKERLNEKVIQEIGLLNGAFHTERTEIASKIELLNQSLRQLEYRAGTYMRLEPRPVRDREITDFQNSLRECLAGTFEGTLEADEARYLLIEKFLARLREEPRWREKVTDVRRWFDFVARELDAATDVERGYYEDSTGQSGGEKAKLAFTILVAAIAYQYDIDPSRPLSERFHFVVVDEMFSKVDDHYAEYALELFRKFGLQLLIVAPLDAKARVTEPYVGCYLHVVKELKSNHSEIYSMTAREFEEAILSGDSMDKNT